jgi:hypothetical protein
MRTRAREIVCGRAAAAWRRACARATAWMRDVCAASSWAAAGDPLRLDEWTACCFGTRLAELINANDRRAVASVPTPRRRHAALDKWRRDGANAAARAPVPPRANNGTRPAERRVPAAAPARAMGRARLAALAGDVSRALRKVGGRGRSAFELLEQSLETDARKVAPNLLTARSASIANAALEERVSARLDRSLARPFGRVLSRAVAPNAAAASGWQRRLDDPEPDLVLTAGGAPIGAGSAAAAAVRTPPAPGHSRQAAMAKPKANLVRSPPPAKGSEESNPYRFGEPHARSWRRRISPPDPQLTLARSDAPTISRERATAADPVRREPAPAPEPALSRHDRTAAMPAPLPSTSATAMAPSPSSQAASAVEPAQAFASATADKHSEARASGPDAAPRPISPRARLDPIEFAEQLRLALIHDARRIGIEV